MPKKAIKKKAASGPKAAPRRIAEERPSLPVEIWPLSKIHRYSNNAKILTPEAVNKVAKSIQYVGWTQPIVVDEDGVILAGHTRLSAAEMLGFREAPVIVREGLSDGQKKTYRLLDNRSALEAKLDYGNLTIELNDLEELSCDLLLTGFDQFELKGILGEQEPIAEIPQDAAPDGEPAPKLKSIRVTEEQYDLIMSAVDTLRQREGDAAISEGRAFELMCASYLAEA